MLGLLNSDATIVRRTFTTSGPEPTPTTAVVATVRTRVCALDAKELGPQYDPAVMRCLLYFPYGTDIRTSDRVTVDSLTYEIEGVDFDAGAERHHVEANAKRVD
jgi:hypothetical protein